MLNVLRLLTKSRPWLHPLLALALLCSAAHAVDHAHEGQPDAQQCYACEFSPDLGLAAADEVPNRPPFVAAQSRPFSGGAVLAATASDYDARGPPLLN